MDDLEPYRGWRLALAWVGAWLAGSVVVAGSLMCLWVLARTLIDRVGP